MRHLGWIAALAAGAIAWPCASAAQPALLHTPTPAPYTTTVGAHARYSKARINLNAPNLALLAAVIAAGGGPTAFDAQKLLGVLTGNGPSTQTELAALTKRFGAQNLASFFTTFHFVITDAVTQFAADGMALPASPIPDPTDGKALAAALLATGTAPRGSFDVEYLLDGLVSHVVHVAVMNDIDANPDLGPKADANYHAVFAQMMLDVKSADSLAGGKR
ncbi:MAG: hypothetical protein ABSB70_08200 [Candidatus Velthaea sp.]